MAVIGTMTVTFETRRTPVGDNEIDITDMYAIHECLRREFAGLPLKVKVVAEGNAERAAVVGGHVLLMSDFLEAHHLSEDALVWPILKERSPEHDGLVETMIGQHHALESGLVQIRANAKAWMATPGIQERATLHQSLIGFERELLHHLAVEEQEVIPIMVRDLNAEEYAAVGEHARAAIAPETTPIVLGLILDDATEEQRQAITGAMPPEALAAFEQFGRPVYQDYKAKLTDY